ncbi:MULTISPECIES: hypothetical protein [unclassified Bradyrhizobium]|uniref:hypothetical protein n=1 Tax=unclassified Bradyrhizobium TaxID=2631580 RepID=UPI002FF43BC4
MQRFAALVLLFALIGNVGSKADDLLPQLRKSYEDCIHRTVRLQGLGSTSEAIDLAFLACQSQEQAIIERLAALGMAPATSFKALQAFKLRLRKAVK